MLASSIIALMMEEASTSETWVNFYQTTRRNNPEDSHLQTRRCENLKSHDDFLVSKHVFLTKSEERTIVPNNDMYRNEFSILHCNISLYKSLYMLVILPKIFF
jgi:hypothetical protein